VISSVIKKYPATITIIPLALGISLSYFTGINLALLPEWLFWLILTVLAGFILILYKKRNSGEIFLFPFILVIILFGIFSFQYSYNKKDADNIEKETKVNRVESVLKGVLIEKPVITDEKIKFLADVSSLNTGDKERSVSGTVLITVYKNKFKEESGIQFIYGDVVEIKGRLEKLPSQRNPGEFDYGNYLKLQGVDAVFTSFGYENIELKGHENKNIFYEKIIYPVKDYSVNIIDSLYKGREGEFLKGLLLGERSNISRQMKEDFINAGVAHIIAVSGLNVAFVALIIWGLLLFIPLKPQYKVFITIGFLLFYMVLTGSTPSIVRAVIMASILLIAQLTERKPNSYNIISFAALVILVIDPKQLFDSGFILSFSAILSLVIIYSVFEKWLNSIEKYKDLNKNTIGKILKAVILLFAGTLAAQVGTLPITALMFKKISVISLAANLFAIPLSNLSLALGFITVLVSPVSMWLAGVFAAFNNFLLYWQIWLIELCARLDFSYIRTYFADWLLFAVFYTVLILILTVSAKNYIGRVAVSAALIINYFVWFDVSNLTNETEITFLYSGASNCTLIKMPEGSSILINTGTSNEKNNSAQRTVLPYLGSKRLNKIDLLVINRMDKNEFRNLLYLVTNIEVGKILIPAFYRKVLEDKSFAGNFRNTNVQYITQSEIINKKGNFRLYLYYDSLLEGKSMMTQFVYGEQSFVFNDAKDAAENVYNAVFLNNMDLTLQALRVTGSGSFATTPAELITRFEPEYIVIGETLTGRKKVNSEIFIKTLDDFTYNVLNVETDGAVILRTNGEITRRVVWK